MNNLSLNELLACQARGLIPGPSESDEEFASRIKSLPSKNPDAKEIFFFKPDWVEVTYSKKGLLPWQGGCTYIQGNSLTLQVRKRIWGYDTNEIIAHELVHAVRMAYFEPLFEEILAYQTSKSRFRRTFGPLFRTSKESLFCVLSLALLSFVNLLYTIPLLTSGLTLLLLSFFVIRLQRCQRIFAKTLGKLSLLYKDKAMHVALQLTDREIVLFSKKSVLEIEDYAKGQSCLRWRLISAVAANSFAADSPSEQAPENNGTSYDKPNI